MQETVNQEYVERTLMIRHKHIRSILVDIFTASYADRQQKQAACKHRPQMTRIITPEIPIAQSAPYNGNDSRDDGSYQKQRQPDTDLINDI